MDRVTLLAVLIRDLGALHHELLSHHLLGPRLIDLLGFLVDGPGLVIGGLDRRHFLLLSLHISSK